METKDISDLPALRNSCPVIELNGSDYSDEGTEQADFHTSAFAVKEIKISSVNLMLDNNDGQIEENHCIPDEIQDKDLVHNNAVSRKCAKLTESVSLEKEINTMLHTDNGCLAVRPRLKCHWNPQDE